MYARSASRIASTNPSARFGANPSSHHKPSTSTRRRSRSMRGSIRPTNRSPKEDRQDVVAPAPLLRLEEALPDEVEPEQALEQFRVPEERVERGDKRDRRRRLGRRVERGGLGRRDEPLAAHSLHRDRHELAALDELGVERLADVGVGDARERASRSARAEQAVGAVAGKLLVQQLLALGDLPVEQLGGQEPLDEVVVAAVAVAPREPDHAGDRVRLEHRAHGVLGQAEPVLRRAALPARSRRRRAGLRRGSARAPARRPRRSPSARRRGSAAPCGRRSRGTTGTRPPE